MAMNDVYAGGQLHKGSFRADLLEMRIGGVSVAGGLVQGINYQFNQQVSMLFELGSNFVYYMGGRAQGTFSLTQIATAPRIAGLVASRFRDICDPQDFTFDAKQGCVAPEASNASVLNQRAMYEFHDAVLVSVGGNSDAQSVQISSALSFMFANMRVEDGT